MKQFLLCFFLILFTYAINIKELQNQIDFPSLYQVSPCKKEKYGDVGDTCDPTQNSLRRCKLFLACSNSGGQGFKCVPGHIGASCKSDMDCWQPPREGVRCIHGRCMKPSHAGYGCEYDEDCWSGRCKDGKCIGRSLGEACNSNATAQCDKGYYCSYKTNTCTRQKQLSEECNDYQPIPESQMSAGHNYYHICHPGTKCLSDEFGSTPACKKFRYKDEGEDCINDQECRYGLYCASLPGQTRKCVAIPATTFACQGSPRNCTLFDEDCICKEDQVTGECKPWRKFGCGFVNTFNKWRDCGEENLCPLEKDFFTAWMLDPFTQNTCMGKHCGDIPRQFFCCAMSEHSHLDYTNANIGPWNCGTPAYVSVLIVFFILIIIGMIVVGIVGVAVFIYIRRKNRSFEQIY